MLRIRCSILVYRDSGNRCGTSYLQSNRPAVKLRPTKRTCRGCGTSFYSWPGKAKLRNGYCDKCFNLRVDAALDLFRPFEVSEQQQERGVARDQLSTEGAP
jgi:hypothetical protein